MKILVVDIETTGFYVNSDAIVEIGIALVDTKTGNTKLVFNNVVKHKKFKPKRHAKSWIFENTTLTVEDVENAKPLEDYFDEIQTLFSRYPMTAYNKPFDLRFLNKAGFRCNDVKCLMATATKYSEYKDKNGNRKKPSVEEIYNQFFMKGTDKIYIEEHRAGADAMDEAKILLHMVELKDENVISKDAPKPKFKPKPPQSNYPKYDPVDVYDKFPFGKFKNKSFSYLVKNHTKYIGWCLKNVKGFKLTDNAKKIYEQCLEVVTTDNQKK